jgi:hypothetical protein
MEAKELGTKSQANESERRASSVDQVLLGSKGIHRSSILRFVDRRLGSDFLD